MQVFYKIMKGKWEKKAVILLLRVMIDIRNRYDGLNLNINKNQIFCKSYVTFKLHILLLNQVSFYMNILVCIHML